jgi:hypothetical protein
VSWYCIFRCATQSLLFVDLLKNSGPNLSVLCQYCHNHQESSGNSDEKNKKGDEYPEEPTTCCMSGCANCVWLEYAEKLSRYYRDGGEEAFKKIQEKVTDPNMKAFLLHELRMKQK